MQVLTFMVTARVSGNFAGEGTGLSRGILVRDRLLTRTPGLLDQRRIARERITGRIIGLSALITGTSNIFLEPRLQG